MIMRLEEADDAGGIRSIGDGNLIGKDIALNDIVIGREGHLRVIRFKNYVNDEL